jgi:hypothetical protein
MGLSTIISLLELAAPFAGDKKALIEVAVKILKLIEEAK